MQEEKEGTKRVRNNGCVKRDRKSEEREWSEDRGKEQEKKGESVRKTKQRKESKEEWRVHFPQ